MIQQKTTLFKACIFMLVTGGCTISEIPLLSRKADSSVELTAPYEWIDANGYIQRLEVNTGGISIRNARVRSDGALEIMLGGSVAVNGIPQALHEIVWPDGVVPLANLKKTDFPVTGTLQTFPPRSQDPRPIEDSISLKTVSENSKYTAVTISGLLTHINFISLREENEALRLYSKNYINGYNSMSALFNPSVIPMIRELVYYQDPNFFSDNGYNPASPIYRGSKAQGGGFTFLIWDGANPKRAVFSISYDNRKTFRKAFVDWSNVQFTDVPLQSIEWQNTIRASVNSNYHDITLGGSGPGGWTGSAIIGQYTSSDLFQPAASIAEGLSPVFAPSNATNKNFHFEDMAGQILGAVYTGTYTRIELEDRVRISALRDAGTGIDTAKLIIAVSGAQGAPPSQVTLTITAEVR
ncbi:MAG: hypothetical protein LBD22_04290 [Spirochaetaceae bacterium]|nr:hypothetical protein [Spirochaetaceae bacterium]